MSKRKLELNTFRNIVVHLHAKNFSNFRSRLYSNSHKVATQANVRKTWCMQMGNVLLDICLFWIWTLTFETFDSVATLWDWLYSLSIKGSKQANVQKTLDMQSPRKWCYLHVLNFNLEIKNFWVHCNFMGLIKLKLSIIKFIDYLYSPRTLQR